MPINVEKKDLAYFGGPKAVTKAPNYEWPIITQEEIDAVVDLLKRRKISIAKGDVIEEFEKNFAKYHNVKHCILQNNGTSTLHAAYWAAGVGPGDEVIVPTYTWLASATPILATNGIPVFCDIDPKTLCADPEDIKNKITDKTKAICVVHIWGHACDMDPIMEIAEQYDLKVIEDCSHAHGTEYKGKKVGTIGHIGCFSLQGGKPMTGGEAGALITNDSELFERAMLVGQYKRTMEDITIEKYKPYAFTALGWKYRAHPVAAVLANIQLKYLDERNAERNRAHEYFIEKLNEIPGIDPPYNAPYSKHGGWYGLRLFLQKQVIEKLGYTTEKIVELLKAEGTTASLERYRLLHLEPLFSEPFNFYGNKCPFNCPHVKYHYKWKKGDLPVSEEIVTRLISLNRFEKFDEEYIDMTIEAFRKVFYYIFNSK
ncbi:MAG: DegT/DnrJ/EryC1/StrS family aminotransferase [Promethearchaeota archaeon]